MFKDLIMNPVIIGLIAGIIAYNYMSWRRRKMIEKRLRRGKKVKPQEKQNDIIIPSLVAVIVWFIAYGYINYSKNNVSLNNLDEGADCNANIPQYKLVKESNSENQVKSADRSFTMIQTQNDIMLPTSNKVPGVFVDLYK
jgi:hypothetical protein